MWFSSAAPFRMVICRNENLIKRAAEVALNNLTARGGWAREREERGEEGVNRERRESSFFLRYPRLIFFFFNCFNFVTKFYRLVSVFLHLTPNSVLFPPFFFRLKMLFIYFSLQSLFSFNTPNVPTPFVFPLLTSFIIIFLSYSTPATLPLSHLLFLLPCCPQWCTGEDSV